MRGSMRIGIIGTGAMATIFGGGLIGAGHDVVFVGKNHATVAVLNEHGLTVDRDGSPSSNYAASATIDAASVGICDIVLVVVKSYDTASAVQTLEPLVGPETIIVSLQNGIGTAEHIAAAFPEAQPIGRIVQGVTYQGGTIIGPGHVYHHSTKKTVFGPLSEAGFSAAERLAALWMEAGWEASVTEDIDAEVWKKVVVNGVNAIAATTRLPSRAMTESPAVRQLVEDVVLEGMAVAHALGHLDGIHRDAARLQKKTGCGLPATARAPSGSRRWPSPR